MQQDLVIKSADKGGAIVLQNKTDYVEDAIRLLSDNATYIKLNKDPMADFAKEANTLIYTAFQEGIITKTESSFLQKAFYQTP